MIIPQRETQLCRSCLTISCICHCLFKQRTKHEHNVFPKVWATSLLIVCGNSKHNLRRAVRVKCVLVSNQPILSVMSKAHNFLWLLTLQRHATAQSALRLTSGMRNDRQSSLSNSPTQTLPGPQILYQSTFLGKMWLARIFVIVGTVIIFNLI